MNRQPLPLAGFRVVDYSHFLAGPYLSRCLAALGADVIKVERPTTGDAGRQHAYFIDGQSGYFLQQNMGKKGLCINLKDPRGLEMMHRLTDAADVFVENYRPGVLGKLGLGYEELSKRNPGLVYCSVSAYGHTGPDSHRAGYGLIAEAKSGIMAMVGSPGEAPPLLPVALGDMYTGSHGVAAVCAALLGRAKSGRGQHIDLEILPRVRVWVGARTVAQCLSELDGADVPCAKVQTIADVLADPQIAARHMVIEQEHPLLGKVRLPNLPFRFSGCDTTQTVPAPLLGQHNREIAAELGYTGGEIDAMVGDGVLYAEEAVARLAATDGG